MAQTKSEWRRVLLSARAAIPESVRRSASDDIAARVRELVCMRDARTLLGYVALGAEVDVGGMLQAATARSMDVWVPAMPFADQDPSWAFHGGADGRAANATTFSYPVVAVVPGVGFDFFGTRLGRGSGFYDRVIARLRRAGQVAVVGVAFDCQIVPELPRDAWDEAVDLVVSESRVVGAATAGSQLPRHDS